MNWDAIGAAAELLGAIGVIASLVYLAGQIRDSREQTSQNTRAVRAAAYQQFQEQLRAIMMQALSVPSLEGVVFRGMADPEILNEEEAGRFRWWLIGVFMIYENAHYQYRTKRQRSRRSLLSLPSSCCLPPTGPAFSVAQPADAR